MTDPVQTIVTGSMFTHVGYALAKLGVADLLADRVLPVRQMADAVGADPDALLTLLRTGAGLGLFVEAPPRFFALTQAGQLLREGVPQSRHGSFIRSVERNGPLLAEMLHTIRTGRPAWEKVHGAGIFQQPDEAYKLELHDSPRLLDLLADHDMSGVQTLVDIAGGQGRLVEFLLRRHPQMRAVLFELPPAIRAARHAMPEDVAGRCEFAEGDFFTSPIPGGGDLYLITRVLHNWADDQIVTILGNVRAAMPATARLLVAERFMARNAPEPLTLFLNMLMLLLNGGRERSEDEYRELVERAGFTVTDIRHPASAGPNGVPAESLLEAAPK